MSYAAGTEVSVERSRAEIGTLLSRAGATQRLMGEDDARGEAWIIFTLAGRQVRLKLPLPKLDQFKEKLVNVGSGRMRTRDLTPEQQRRDWEQACRQRWRQMLLLVKAKLEAIELGLSTVEREFLADIYLPDGRSVHEAIAEDVKQSYLDGKMPPLLGMGDRNG